MYLTFRQAELLFPSIACSLPRGAMAEQTTPRARAPCAVSPPPIARAEVGLVLVDVVHVSLPSGATAVYAIEPRDDTVAGLRRRVAGGLSTSPRDIVFVSIGVDPEAARSI